MGRANLTFSHLQTSQTSQPTWRKFLSALSRTKHRRVHQSKAGVVAKTEEDQVIMANRRCKDSQK